MSCLSGSIHGPGRGTILRQAGKNARARYGSAKPRASAWKTAIATGTGWVTARPTAAPMKGAVHGVAATAARAPVKSDPAYPGLDASPWPTPPRLPAQGDDARQPEPHGEEQVGEEGHEHG